MLPNDSEDINQIKSHHWIVRGDETRAQPCTGKAAAHALKCLQWICHREKYCLNQQMRTISTWKISSWVFVANCEIQLRPDRDGSTNLGRFLFDSSLNWGREEGTEGALPTAGHHLPYSSLSHPDQWCGELQARFECCYLGVQARIGSHPSRPGGSRRCPTCSQRREKVHTLLLCESGVALRLPVLPDRNSSKRGVSALHICRGSAIFSVLPKCENILAQQQEWNLAARSGVSQECPGRAAQLEHTFTGRSSFKENPAGLQRAEKWLGAQSSNDLCVGRKK